MGWGLTYTGHGQILEVADAIETTADQKGMSARREFPGPDTIILHLAQTAPWHRVVRRALPQRISWTLVQTGRTFEVTMDARYAPWYVTLIVMNCSVVATLLIGGAALVSDRLSAANGASTIILAFCMVLTGLAGLFVGWHLTNATGGRQTIQFWHSIRDRVEDPRQLLQSKGSTHSWRVMAESIAYLAYAGVVAISGIIVLGYVDLSKDRMLLLVVLSFCACVACLLVSLPLLWRNRDLDARVEPMLAGFSSILGAAFVLSAHLPWFISRSVGTPASIAFIRQVSMLSAQEPSNMTDEARVDVWQRYRQLANETRVWALICAMGSAFIGLTGIWLVASGVSLSLHTWPLRTRLVRFAEHSSLRGTIEGTGIIQSLRRVFVTPWVLVSLVMLLAIVGIAGFTAHAVAGPCPGDSVGPPARSVNASIVLVSAALGHADGHRGIELAVRSAWVGYGVLCLSMLGLSIGQLVLVRRSAFQRLRHRSTSDAANQERAQSILGLLAGNSGLRTPRLVVCESDGNDAGRPSVPYASAQQFGLVRPRRFIEVSSRCLTMLEDSELKGLLAHEMAHFVRGHALLDNLLRLLGRLTFVGDQAVRMFQLTVGYELDADRVAVETLGADPQALIRCLWKMRNVRAAEGASVLAGPNALAMLTRHGHVGMDAATSDVDTLPFKARWRLAIRLFLWQYTSGSDQGSVYWHPLLARRVDALRSIASRGR